MNSGGMDSYERVWGDCIYIWDGLSNCMGRSGIMYARVTVWEGLG